jgi:hypothetical protein
LGKQRVQYRTTGAATASAMVRRRLTKSLNQPAIAPA